MISIVSGACERSSADRPAAEPVSIETPEEPRDPSAPSVGKLASRAVEAGRERGREAPRPESEHYAVSFDEISRAATGLGLHIVARVSVAADSARPPELLFRARCPTRGTSWVVLGRAQHEGYGLDWKSDVAAGDVLAVEADIVLDHLRSVPSECEIDARFVHHDGRVERSAGMMCWRGGTAIAGRCFPEQVEKPEQSEQAEQVEKPEQPEQPSARSGLSIANVTLGTGELIYDVTFRERLAADRRLATRVTCTGGAHRIPRQLIDKSKLHAFEPGETVRVSVATHALEIGSGECDLELRLYEYRVRDLTARRPETVWAGCVRAGVLGEGACRVHASESSAEVSGAPIELVEWTIVPVPTPGAAYVHLDGVFVARRIVDDTFEPALHVTCTKDGHTTVDEVHDLTMRELSIHYLEPGEATTFSYSARSIDLESGAACEIDVVVASERRGEHWTLQTRCLEPSGAERPCTPTP